MGVAATGKEIVMTGVVIYRVVDNMAVEEWMSGDTLGLMRKMGAIPG